MEQIQFAKVCGAGNDFFIIDHRNEHLKGLEQHIVSKYCPRKYGIGADGFMLIESSDCADFKMRIFNRDGSEADMCGNGARCIALYAHKIGLCSDTMTIETGAGILEGEVTGSQTVKLKMSVPHGMVLHREVSIDHHAMVTHFINTGVEHVVVFVPDNETVDVQHVGSAIRYHDIHAPTGTNVNFVQCVGDNTISIRTYERGVEGETLACGTGAVASALISAIMHNYISPVHVKTRGGALLTVYFKLQADQMVTDVYLEGEARVVYEGHFVMNKGGI